jgi:predicted transcriptional regulator YdeE
MNQVTIEGFSVSGPSERTSNLVEASLVGKIPKLWGTFFSSQLPACDKVYGVYFDYESDASGEFAVAVGAKVDGSQKAVVNIAGGTYLAFRAQGAMPAAVIEVWQNIWAHFLDQRPYARAYVTDFEEYSGAEEVTVYVGIEKCR